MAVVSSPKSSSAGRVQFGQFTFDYSSRLLLCNGVRRHLSPKAQQLLHTLIEARPRALPRQLLFEAIWPSTYVVESNLAAIVNELRRALGDDPRDPHFIRTVHAFGYAFCGDVRGADAQSVPYGATLQCESRSFPLPNGAHVVGRGHDATVVLMNRMVSRLHARITVDGEDVWIEDLDSTNGTFVNGNRITRPFLLAHRTSSIVFGTVGGSIIRRSLSTTGSLQKIALVPA